MFRSINVLRVEAAHATKAIADRDVAAMVPVVPITFEMMHALQH